SSSATGGLATGWAASTIGNNNSGNAASYANGVFTIAAQSNDISGSFDSFEFASQPIVGDGSIVARVAGWQNANGNTTIGVMLREGPTPTATNAFMEIQSGGTLVFQWRNGTGTWTGASYGVGVGLPFWLKLVRSGSTMTGYASPNGVDWTQVASVGFTN